MHQSDLTSDSGFISSDIPLLDNSFTEIEPLHSDPATHSELYSATRMGKRFVLKVLKEPYRTNVAYRALLRNEFDIGYHLSHAGIAQTIAFDTLPALGEVIVIEYIDGMTLKEAIEAKKLSRESVRKIIGEVCDALQYLHSQQIVHRDLKPENILLTHNGLNAKLIDFGLSCSDAQTLFKQPAGTRRYASPELLDGKTVDNRSDIYALGVILTLVAYDSRTRRIARRCMASERNARYPDANAVKRAISRPSPWRKVILSALCATLLLGALYIGYSQGQQSVTPRTEIQQIVVERTTPDSTALSVKEFIDAQTAAQERFDALYRDIETMLRSAYNAHYITYDDVTNKEQLEALVNSNYPLREELTQRAMSMLNATFSPENMQYTDYKTSISQLCRRVADESYSENMERTTAAFNRIYLSD